MNANLLTLAQHALGGDFSKLAGQFLGESPDSIQSALTSLLPAVLGRRRAEGRDAGRGGGPDVADRQRESRRERAGQYRWLFGGGGATAMA